MRTLVAILLFLFGSTVLACRPSTIVINNDVTTHLYQPSRQSVRTVLILPPTGDSIFLERQYAREFCAQGLQAVIVEKWRGLSEFSVELEVHDRLLNRAQRALQKVMGYYSASDYGVLGTSIGAIHAANALALFPQISTGYLIAGGGPIWDVIAKSEQSDLYEVRKQRLPLFGFADLDEYSAALKETISIEATEMAGTVLNKKVGIIVATEDNVVPSDLQENYVEAFQPEDLIRLDRGHFWSIVSSWWLFEDRIIKFLK